MTGAPTKYWHALDDGRVQCDLCPRECKLREGQRGLCYVRARHEDAIVLVTFGRSSGFCIDPIEKKPLNHFLPGTAVLSFGTAGCNLACRFCQNWDISKARRDDVLADQASPADLAQTASRTGCRSVAFTYNDPIVFHEYAIAVAEACQQDGVRTVAVSSGYVHAAPRAEFYAVMDAANIDLKSFDDEFYHRVCAAALGPVLDTLEYLRHETDVWLEITTLLIPGRNDSTDEIDAMTRWVATHLGRDIPHHFTAFHPDFKMTDVPFTPAETLRLARRIAIDNGLQHVYTGNLYDPEGQATYCAGCGRVVIGRNGYRLTKWRLDDDGRCRHCSTRCPGVFARAPGSWGSRRRRVRISPGIPTSSQAAGPNANAP